MRIFPHPEEGLHPAFQPNPNQGISHTVLPGIVSVATAAGLLRLGFAYTFRRPTPLASAGKTVANATIVAGLVLEVLQSNVRIGNRNFLSSQNIEVPKPTLFDRLGHFDQDDSLLLGGCIGLLAASRMRRPWTVTGWQRQVAAFTLGSFACDMAKTLHRTWSRTPEDRENFVREWHKWRAQRSEWQPVVMQYAPIKLSAESSASLQLGEPTMASERQHDLSMMLGPTMRRWDQAQRVEDSPHVAMKFPDEKEAIPIPATNYTWSSSRPIQDLKHYIAKLTERRQRLSREAEFLWAWLSEKEAEYYNQSGLQGQPDTPEARARLHYLRQLSEAHCNVWREVSTCDWMIADSHKRIQQLQSKLTSDDESVTWRAGCSEEAREVKPEHVIRSLQLNENLASALVDRFRLIRAKSAPANVPAGTSTERMLNPLRKEITTAKEYLEDLEKELADAEAAVKAARELQADLEKRQK